jgi:hypothetical protein
MIRRARKWVNTMQGAKSTIARLAEPFIHGNSVSSILKFLHI